VRRAREVDALYVHGRALAHIGRFAAAEEAYAAGLARLADPAAPVPDSEVRRELFLDARLKMAVGTGDAEAAIQLIRESLAGNSNREITLELLQADPAVAALLGPEAWASLAQTP
jgi:hypothetical protein